MYEQKKAMKKIYWRWNCLKCNDIITNAYTGIECEFCSHKYHLKCLNSTEYCDLGLKETILFICDVCQNELGQ